MTTVQIVDDFWNREAGWVFVPELSRAGYLTYEKVEGDVLHRRKVYAATEALMARAAAEREANAAKRFDLNNGFVIGSLPLNLRFATGYEDARKNEDTARIKRFWNEDERFQPFKHWTKTI